jgi:hypothetical protein
MSRATSTLSATIFLAAAIGLNATAANGASDLDRAFRILSAKKFVDLTHSFSPDTPVWSGFGQGRMSPTADPKTHDGAGLCNIAVSRVVCRLAVIRGTYGMTADTGA